MHIGKWPEAAPAFKSKQQMARDMIDSAVAQNIPFSIVLMDSWVFNKENTDYIETHHKNWIMGCKSNRIIPPPRRASKSPFATSPPHSLPPTSPPCNPSQAKHPRPTHTRTVNMQSQGRIKILITYDNPQLLDEPNFFVTNRKEWDTTKIFATYRLRWPIE